MRRANFWIAALVAVTTYITLSAFMPGYRGRWHHGWRHRHYDRYGRWHDRHMNEQMPTDSTHF